MDTWPAVLCYAGAHPALLGWPHGQLGSLCASLQACLRDAQPGGQDEDKKRSLIGCFRPRRSSKLASEEELEKAAQYVVARFGAFENEDVSDEEDEGAEELEGKVSTTLPPTPSPPPPPPPPTP